MKKVSLIFGIALIVASSIAFNGCKKKGCTDPDSVNYDPKAKKDDFTCKYEGEVVFWYGQVTADSLLNDGATSLTYYVDGNIVGSSAASIYWTGATGPDCGEGGAVTVTKDLSNVKTQSYSYSVKDQTGFEYWGGTLNFNANTCLVLELPW